MLSSYPLDHTSGSLPFPPVAIATQPRTNNTRILLFFGGKGKGGHEYFMARGASPHLSVISLPLHPFSQQAQGAPNAG